jgi:hypothetical protein
VKYEAPAHDLLKVTSKVLEWVGPMRKRPAVEPNTAEQEQLWLSKLGTAEDPLQRQVRRVVRRRRVKAILPATLLFLAMLAACTIAALYALQM